jgi:dTDP-4-amino-4,6-dideoxygalactose transaminase
LRDRIDDDTAAVILVHIGGVISEDVDEIMDICKEYNIHLIEDAAHAHGAEIDGRPAGTLGVAGGFSFFPTKVMTTGEGGIVTTDDDALANRIRMIRNHGKNPDKDNSITDVGSNFRMSEVTALFGVQQTRTVQKKIEDRERIAAHYDEALTDVSGVEPLELPENVSSSYYKYVVYLDDYLNREAVKTGLAEHNVSATGEVYADLCHDAPLWEDYTYCGKRRSENGDLSCNRYPGCGCDERQDGFPGAEQIRDNHLCLPSYPGLTEAELDHVVDSLREVITKQKEATR